MKIAALISRILLGLMFVVFGLNGIHPFIPMKDAPPMPEHAMQFAGALMSTHYMHVIAALQVLGGLLLLIGRYTILGLVILGPILFNILCFHIFFGVPGVAPGAFGTVLWFVCFLYYFKHFSGVFAAKPE
jgi:putative oxidoreductase